MVKLYYEEREHYALVLYNFYSNDSKFCFFIDRRRKKNNNNPHIPTNPNAKFGDG